MVPKEIEEKGGTQTISGGGSLIDAKLKQLGIHLFGLGRLQFSLQSRRGH